MAKGSRVRYRSSSRKLRPTPYSLPSCRQVISEDLCLKNCSSPLDKKDWEDATCSVCMECPHKAVLLLCSSHDKGCRPYMCGTSFRYSNCLDQYQEAYTKAVSSNHGLPLNNYVDNPIIGQGTTGPVDKCKVTQLACPLCRGQVKGWTVVEPAREYLNAKERSCMQDDCSFVGTFKELRRHMRAEHPSAQPRKVDPNLEQNWRRLERERDRDDVISTIRSTMPGAMVFGDYVIEGNRHGFDSDEEDDVDADAATRNGNIELSVDRNFVNFFLLFQAFGPSGNDLSGRLGQAGRNFHHQDENTGVTVTHSISPVVGLGFSDEDNDNASNNNEDDDGGISLVSRLHRQGRVLLGRSGRRRRRRQANRSQR
ncbi:hypothetical protein SLEP1_g33540 [Rubroshorea leprosula]|uniref:Uncharacterized protein n=1 Tax=Rubroshorea leprosula TaxID=152421 RepID=A0AAV5KGX2_9ROSI|nr:hypothetical protein SLEP1_g33540 [Rubroshorea leprosula]